MSDLAKLVEQRYSGMMTERFDVMGLGIQVRSNAAACMELLRNDNPSFVHDSNPDEALAAFNICHLEYASPDELPPQIRQMVIQSDPKLFIEPRERELILFASRSNAGDALRALFVRLVILHYRARGFRFFHGSVAESGGDAIAFLGDKGTGKTSMLLDLIYQHGWRYVTDDIMMVGCEDGQPVVLGLHVSVNLDMQSNGPEAHVQELRRDITRADRWLLPRTEKQRFFMPPDLLTCKARLRHVLFPTIHPLSSVPSIADLTPALVETSIDFQRYKAPLLPNLTFPDVGIRCDGCVETALAGCHGMLFLGGMDLAANTDCILESLGADVP